MTCMRFPVFCRALIVAGLTCAGLACAAGFPERPVTLVALYPAGGAADVLSCILAKKLEEQLGQPVADWAGFVGADVARMRKIAEQSSIKAD